MQVITTTFQNRKVCKECSHSHFIPDVENRERSILNIYPKEKFQTILGFGGAITDAAAYVYDSLSPNLRRKFLQLCYGSQGLHYILGRMPIDSCDFSLEPYCADDDEHDVNFQSFSFERPGKYIFPLLDDILSVQPALKLLLSPWSPPAYMKNNRSRTGGGRLREDYADRWAKYLCHYLQKLSKRGYPIFALSVQNEPNAAQTWDSCLYSAEEERDFLSHHLAKEMRRMNLQDVILTVHDHNKERLFDRVDTICKDSLADRLVGAAGYHWYSGDHFEALRLVRRKYPDKLLFFTEGCIEYSCGQKEAQIENAQRYAREIIFGICAGMNAFFDWNILLNAEGGPNYVNNFCDAPIMVDVKGKALKTNLSYDYISHFSRYIMPGAVRLGTTCYDDTLGFCALQNPDQSIVAVFLNTGAQKNDAHIRLNGLLASIKSPANSITTLCISQEELRGELSI